MSRPRPIVVAIALLASAPRPARSVEADRTPTFREDVEWIITKDEAKTYKGLKSDDEREAFVKLFWAKRDPTPGTARNEYREEYERRLAYSDDRFSTTREKGRRTDRGRVYCLLGAPTREGTFQPESPGYSKARSIDDIGARKSGELGGGLRGSLPPILWTYENLPESFGIPSVVVRFEDYEGFGVYALDAAGTAAAALKKAVDLAIKQPDLKKAPEYAAGPEAAQAPAAAGSAAAPAATERTAAIVTLLSHPDPGAFPVAIEMATLVSAAGQPFVPLAIGTSGKTAPADPIYFERVTADGAEKDYAEGAQKEAFLRTLNLPPGDYQLEAGIFDRATSGHGYVSRPLHVAAPTQAFALSTVLLAKATDMLPEPAPETDPLTFGRIRLRPNLDASYGRGDELMIFVEAYNVKEDAAGQAQVAASFAFDKAGKFWNEVPEARQEAVRLSPGRYLITQILPLSRFAPASYKLRISVKDATAGATAMSEATFSVR